MRRVVLVLLPVLLVVLGVIYLNLDGWQSNVTPENVTPDNSSNVFRIGVMSATDEELPEYMFLGDLALDDINSYCEEVNSSHRFEFVYMNASSSPALAVNNTQAYYESGVEVVVGYGWSSQLFSSSRAFSDEHDMVLISPSSTAPNYLLNDTVFRLSPTDFDQGVALAHVIRGYGADAVIVIYRGDAWGRGICDTFTEEFKKIGGGLVEKVEYSPTLTTFGTNLEWAQGVVSSAADLYGWGKVSVLYLGFSECTTVLKEASDYAGLMNVTWFGSDGTFMEPGILGEAEDVVLRVKLISPKLILPDSSEKCRVSDLYEVKFIKPLEFYVANLYDSCWIAALSALEANSAYGADVIKVLPKLAKGYVGITGNCTLGLYGDRAVYTFGFYGYVEEDGTTYQRLMATYYSDSRQASWID
jgi:branched-chain amino acid transport system substrate-binding protein